MNVSNISIFWTTFAVVLLSYIGSSDADDSSSSNSSTSTTTSEPTSGNAVPSCIFGVSSTAYVLFSREFENGKDIDVDKCEIPTRLDRRVVFLAHGFVSEANNSYYYELAKKWLEKEDVLIFSLDWQDAACDLGMSFTDYLAYGSAVENVPVVGNRLAKFVKDLIRKYGLKLENTIAIGHSLGAHVVGFSGKRLQKDIGKSYPLLIGLDPAGPLYSAKSCCQRLCKSDAVFVEIFHTTYLLGIRQPIGHVDFYFDGGGLQKGCYSVSCSHIRSVEYLTSSLDSNCEFIGTKWTLGSSKILPVSNCTRTTCSIAGLEAPHLPARGTFAVKIESEEPYCTQVHKN